jgi:hypothetical protein
MVMNDTVSWITFGKDRYHQHLEMEEWCRTYVGEGKWIGGRIDTWEGMEPNIWAIESMFGNTTFMFKDPKNLTLFLLRWA